MYYDVFGNMDYMKVGNSTLADYTYASNNGNFSGLNYGNGDSVAYTYDKLDRIIGECYNGVQKATYTYAPNGNISMITDQYGKLETKQVYFTTDIQTNAFLYLVNYNYDSDISMMLTDIFLY